MTLKVAEKASAGLTLTARLGRQDKAGCPAGGAIRLKARLHVVF
jgi:hypothetical protein